MSEEAKNETKLEEPSSISEAEAAAAKAKAEAKSKKASPEQIAKAEAAFERAQAKVKQMRIASEAAWKAEYDTAKARAEKIAAEGGDPGQAFTNKRKRERVFRREMGEPEFWQTKEDKAPARPARTQDEEREITNKVQIPTNQLPKYEPQNILSPGFGGASNYETGIDDLLDETKQKLDRLKNDPDASEDEINMLVKDLKTLESLYDNYNIGMNVFRTAKGGRDNIHSNIIIII